MAPSAGIHGDCPVNTPANTPVNSVDKNQIPPEIMQDSVLIHLYAAYSAVAKKMEQKTKCSQTRGFIMATLRGGVALNSNQIATRLSLDRTVVHRAIKTMLREGLLTQKNAASGRGLLVQLSAKGNANREVMIKYRRALDAKLKEKLSTPEISRLIQNLKAVADLDF
jgi:DNA-binding MarR family transcriptional regulator